MCVSNEIWYVNQSRKLIFQLNDIILKSDGTYLLCVQQTKGKYGIRFGVVKYMNINQGIGIILKNGTLEYVMPSLGSVPSYSLQGLKKF